MCSPRLSYREYERERERVAKLLELANLQPTISAPLTQFMVTLSRMISRFCPQIYTLLLYSRTIRTKNMPQKDEKSCLKAMFRLQGCGNLTNKRGCKQNKMKPKGIYLLMYVNNLLRQMFL